MPDAKSDKVKIFISYARDDAEQVSEIYHRLKAAGFDPWIDSEDLLPGVKWKDAIIKAVREADLFLLCVSSRSSNRQGFIQREIKIALDQLEEKTSDHIYFIPVRLEDCDLPEKVEEFQCVNWFEVGAWEKLDRALRIQAEKLGGKKLPKRKPPSPLKPPSAILPTNKTPLLTQYKTAILAACVLIAALLGFWSWRYFSDDSIRSTLINSAPQIIEKLNAKEQGNELPLLNEEVLRYSLERDGKNGFRFVFNSPSLGYLYVVAPMDKAGKEQWIYLTNNPEKGMKVESNQLKPNDELRFPGGEGFTVKPGEPAPFTLIWSATELKNSEFFSASELRRLTADEAIALKNMRMQSESRKPTIETANGATVIKALSSSQVPLVKDILVRWP